MEAEWPIIGRESELAALTAALDDDDRRGVVLAGAAGVGKTRLAAEALRAAESLGRPTARVTATRAARTIPFGAIAALLPADGPGPADDRAALLRRASEALAARGGGHRLILYVDDAHLLDDASATLIHQLATAGTVFVLLTVRAGEPAPDAVVALWKDAVLTRIELAGLTESAVGDLLGSVLAGPVDPAMTAALARRCRGNALFLRELVLGARAEGTLRQDGHLWRLVGPLAPSSRLVELVEARLTDLSDAERAFMEIVAVGEPLGRAELAALGDENLAERLERMALLSCRQAGRRLELRLSHPIYGDVLRARMPPLRVADVSRRLAEVIDGCGARRREDTLRVATWRLDGGGGRPEQMVEAAVQARWRHDLALAERLVGHALVTGGGFEARFLAAQIANLQGRAHDAEQMLEGLAPATDDQLGRVAISRIDNSAFHLGDVDRAVRIATEAEARLADPEWRHKIAGRRSALLLATTGPGAAAATAVPLLETAEGPALVWACQVAAYSLGRLGRLDQALAASERGHRAHQHLSEPAQWYPFDWHPWVQLFNSCEIHAFAGRLAEAERTATEQYRQALVERSTEAQAWWAWQLCRVLGQRGHLGQAARHGREAVALFERLGRPQFTAFCLAHLVPTLAALGDHPQSQDMLASLTGLHLPTNLLMAADIELASAWAAVADGNLRRARTRLRRTAALAASIDDRVMESTALHDLCRIGHPADAADRLAELCGLIDGSLALGRARHARALLDGDAEALETTSRDFEEMGADLLAAECGCDAAVCWQRAGREQRRARAVRRAAGLVQRCRGARTPALLPLHGRAVLTRGEREVVLLAASGRSTKAIAAELQLSARTVSNHLQRAYDKLGVNRRTELATVLAEEPEFRR